MYVLHALSQRLLPQPGAQQQRLGLVQGPPEHILYMGQAHMETIHPCTGYRVHHSSSCAWGMHTWRHIGPCTGSTTAHPVLGARTHGEWGGHAHCSELRSCCSQGAQDT
eukprot:1157471-Pelagomonas_calceolata.AAC.8